MTTVGAVIAPALVLAATLGYGAPTDTLLHASQGALGARARSPDLTLHVLESGPRRAGAPAGLGGAPARGSRADPPVCSGDVCQPAVSLPGVEPRFDRSAREELFLALVSRVRVEPVTSWIWAVIASGLTLEYRPPLWESADAGAHGWGTVVLRLRLRLDAQGAPVFRERPR
jgi:hypothetical protein